MASKQPKSGASEPKRVRNLPSQERPQNSRSWGGPHSPSAQGTSQTSSSESSRVYENVDFDVILQPLPRPQPWRAAEEFYEEPESAIEENEAPRIIEQL